MVALCTTEEQLLYFTSSFFSFFYFQTLFLRRLCTDFLETLPHDIGLSAIENLSSKFSYVHPKRI